MFLIPLFGRFKSENKMNGNNFCKFLCPLMIKLSLLFFFLSKTPKRP